MCCGFARDMRIIGKTVSEQRFGMNRIKIYNGVQRGAEWTIFGEWRLYKHAGKTKTVLLWTGCNHCGCRRTRVLRKVMKNQHLNHKTLKIWEISSTISCFESALWMVTRSLGELVTRVCTLALGREWEQFHAIYVTVMFRHILLVYLFYLNQK